MAAPHDSHGSALYYPFPYDAGIGDPAFRGMHFGKSPTGALDSADVILGFASLRYLSLTPPDPNFDPMKLDFDRDTKRLADSALLMDASSVYLETFAHHGKLILFHGLSDQGVSPLATVGWYERVEAANGGHVQSWARLFLVPGMTHCHGGPATDDFDMLTAIVDWVEKGVAPDRIIASGKSFPGVTRPLCPYPTYARYAGRNPKDANSFVCVR
jgi:feruloyl esterase